MAILENKNNKDLSIVLSLDNVPRFTLRSFKTALPFPEQTFNRTFVKCSIIIAIIRQSILTLRHFVSVTF